MPDKKTIGVPTMRSMGASFTDWGIGLLGGGIFNLCKGFLGSGLLGSVAAPIAAASFLGGTRGTVISTIAGFQAAEELLGGFFGGLGAGGGSNNEVM